MYFKTVSDKHILHLEGAKIQVPKEILIKAYLETATPEERLALDNNTVPEPLRDFFEFCQSPRECPVRDGPC